MIKSDRYSETRQDATRRWVVRSPARLHFGLMEICPGQSMLFSGCGVTIEEPTTQLDGELILKATSNNTRWRIDNAGPWQARIESVLEKSIPQSMADSVGANEDESELASVGRIRIEQPPMAHVGLGSGTQIACSIATLVAASRFHQLMEHRIVTAYQIWKEVAGHDDRSLLGRLAIATGRGTRSYVGLASHLYGGFIVDHGIAENPDDRKVDCLPVPEAWHVVLARPISSSTISGSREIDYFVRCAIPNPNRPRMFQIIEDEMKPAILGHDISRFGEAVYRYGRYGGELFQSVQGGIYRDSAVAEIIGAIRSLGTLAVGQTSWGPTVYAIVQNNQQAIHLEERLRSKFETKVTTLVTRLTNQPTTVSFQTP